MAFRPYGGAEAVNLILSKVFSVFEDFAYHRELATDDNRSAVLKLSARVDDEQLKGIDLTWSASTRKAGSSTSR